MEPDLAQWWGQQWQRLLDAATQRELISVASHSPDGPQCRTVVLRAVDSSRHCLRFFTDVRSAKCVEIAADPRLCCVHYDADRKLQLRIMGTAQILADSTERACAWAGLSASQRRDYHTATAPGVAQASWQTPYRDAQNEPNNFALIEVWATAVDVLQLDRSQHRRARFVRVGAQWGGEIVTP